MIGAIIFLRLLVLPTSAGSLWSNDSPRPRQWVAMLMEHTQPELENAVSVKRSQLLNALSQHVFNDLPTHLIRIHDMKLLSRTDLWEDLRVTIQGLSNADLLALQSPKVCILFGFRSYMIHIYDVGPDHTSLAGGRPNTRQICHLFASLGCAGTILPPTLA